jgi:hypothetical protein
MADFRLVKDQAANQSAVDYPTPVSRLPPPERRRLLDNQSDAETQRLLRQARVNDQTPAETQRLINQNARAAVSAFEAQTGENQSAAETARLLRQNSYLSDSKNTSTPTTRSIAANEDTGQRPSAKSNPVSNYPSFGAGNTAGVRDNPLDDYVTYTYGITLFVGSAGSYSPGAVNGDVMVASGGIRESRLPQFYEDFYFESFKMESVIGLNAQSRSSNVITIEFTIVEPFGISLMDRLLEVAGNLGAENWHEMVFTLKVDFYGNNDDGEPVNPIAGQTKHFQTKIIGCDIKATSRGSEYRFTAIPFSHQAYTQNVGTTPTTHEAHGQTVQDIFESEGLGSYAKFLNKHQTDLKQKGHQEHPDVYEFVINDQIGKAEIVTSLLNSTRSTPMPNDESKTTKTPQAQQARKSGKSVPLEMQKQRVAINAGTSVIDAINLVVRNSTYISGQVKPGPGSGGGGDGRINWFKITPKIKYGAYDKKRNTHQKTITYHVDPYVIYNTKYPDAPVGLPPADKWSKEYNYIYTGLNQQIIDFSIDFNTMFYTMMTTSREKLAKTDVKPEDTESKKAEDKGSGQANGPKSISPAQMHPVAATDASTSQQGTNNVENLAANDLYKSLMSSSRGDMINVKLKIAGDPNFVKQDDIFYGPGEGAGDSIATDTEEVYIKIFFKAPTDIDQDTGLMDSSSYPDTVFSGIYRVLRVESLFERGQFTQTLDAIRLFGQENGGGGGGMGSAGDQRRSDAPSGAKEMLEGDALDDSLRKMSGSVEYSDEPVKMDDIYQSIRENPPVRSVTDTDEIAGENQRQINKAINAARVAPTTVDPTNVETLFSTGMAP